MEIYNDSVYDLLDVVTNADKKHAPNNTLQIRQVAVQCGCPECCEEQAVADAQTICVHMTMQSISSVLSWPQMQPVYG